MLLLSEFLDDNSHKCYPFAEPNELPTDFIVDAKFMVTGNINKNELCIDYIELTETHIRIFLGIIKGSSVTSIGRVLTCTKPKNKYEEYSCKLIDNISETIIEGFITFGTLDSLPKNKNIISLGATGRLFSGCIIPVTEWCTGLKINDQIYTGIVEIVSGNGIEFSHMREDGIDKIFINSTGFERPEDLTIDTLTDKEILEHVAASWGSPIKSISGAVPDAEGNITIAVDKFSTGAIKLEKGMSTLTISDTYLDECGVTDQDMERMLNNIVTLNERSSSLETLVQQLETQVNTLSHEVSKIQG